MCIYVYTNKLISCYVLSIVKLWEQISVICGPILACFRCSLCADIACITNTNTTVIHHETQRSISPVIIAYSLRILHLLLNVLDNKTNYLLQLQTLAESRKNIHCAFYQSCRTLVLDLDSSPVFGGLGLGLGHYVPSNNSCSPWNELPKPLCPAADPGQLCDILESARKGLE